MGKNATAQGNGRGRERKHKRPRDAAHGVCRDDVGGARQSVSVCDRFCCTDRLWFAEDDDGDVRQPGFARPIPTAADTANKTGKRMSRDEKVLKLAINEAKLTAQENLKRARLN